MKPLFIIAILAAAVTIGVRQNTRLHKLRQQTASLESRASNFSSVRPARSTESTLTPQSASKPEQDALFEEVVTAILDHMDRNRSAAPDQAERRRNMLLTAAKFSAEDIEQFLQKLREDSRLAGSLDENASIRLCLQFFGEASPFAAMNFLKGHRELPEWKSHYAGCFAQYLRASPGEAIRWFDEQIALGNRDIANSSVRQSILLREARIDPDKMLARAMTPDYASDPETLSRLGSFVASTLKQPSDHQQFLAALRRMQSGSNPSPQLLKIRAEYIGGLSQPLADFRFEDSSVLIDSEFTLDEKLNLMRSLSQSGDLDEPAKWADWLLKIDPSTWDNWIAAKGTKHRYPVTEVLSNWARLDNLAAGKWLENLPDSPIKAEMTLEYVLSIAGNEPDRASSYLPLLPEGESKDEIVRRINEIREFNSGDVKQRLNDSIRLKLGN
jgi:hypothetical protein